MRQWLVPVVFCALGSGCGKSGTVTVYPVQGKVTFEGRPLPGGGAISFVPLGDQAGKTAAGAIAEDGTYKLGTHQTDDGSMAGEFRVVITQVTAKEPERTEDGKKAKAGWVIAPADRIPDIYSDTYNSPLRAKVEANGENNFNFNLTRK